MLFLKETSEEIKGFLSTKILPHEVSNSQEYRFISIELI